MLVFTAKRSVIPEHDVQVLKLRICPYRRCDTALAAIPLNEALLASWNSLCAGLPTPHDV